MKVGSPPVGMRWREERLLRMREMGILEDCWKLSDRDASQPPWSEAQHKEWNLRRMEVYAAQIDRMDQGIGRIISTLEATGQLDNTLILFLADNGGCAEELGGPNTRIRRDRPVSPPLTRRRGRPVSTGNDPTIMPGPETTYQSYGVPWANLSNTPFREYKHWVHEGGISTPFIAHWPETYHIRGRVSASAGAVDGRDGDVSRGRGRGVSGGERWESGLSAGRHEFDPHS